MIIFTNNRKSSANKFSLMIIIKRGLHKIPEERVPGDQFISPLIYWIFCFPFSLYHSNVSNRQVDKVGIWRRIHNLNWNCDCIFATGRTITKVDLPFTLPSSTVGWASTNHPDQSVPHLYAGTRVVGIFVRAAPTKRYHPLGSWLSHNSEP